MKLFLAIAAIAATFSFSQNSQAYPASNNISQRFPTSGSFFAGRQFTSSRTASSLGCTTYNLGGSCPSPAPTNYMYIIEGWNIHGYACCSLVPNNRQGVTVMADGSAYSSESLEAVYENNLTDTYWGYINTTSRSPNAGRTQSATAKLDACIGHGEVDMLGTGSTGWSACYNKCDSSSNGYCTSSGTNDGQSTTAAACKDRCDCVMGLGTCANL